MDAEKQNTKPRPWLRYWARFIDISLFGIIAWTLVIPLIPIPVTIPLSIIYFLILLAWTFVEAFVLLVLGTTPGKFALAIDFHSTDSESPTYTRLLERSFDVWLKGMACGIPIISFFTFSYSYNQLEKNGNCTWDVDHGFVVTHRLISPLRVTIAVALIVGVMVANYIAVAAAHE